ncbi:MAG: hypothetical protein AAFR74_02555 [Pseudomonadota bacterium]
MKWIAAVTAFVFGLAPLSFAQSNTDLVKYADEAMLKRIVAAVGDEVTNSTTINGAPSIAAKDADTGLLYGLTGTACTEGRCNGIEISARWTANSYNSDLAKLNELNLSRAAVSVGLQDNNDGSKSVLVSRYLILDHGQVFENLRLNTSVFVLVASGLGESL